MSIHYNKLFVVSMNYKQLYFDLVNSIRDKNHLLEPGLTTRHSIIPPAAGGSISRGFIHVTARELYVLRKLLVKVFPGNGAVYQAFNLLKTEFYARNSHEYEETCAITYLEMEIATIDEMVNDARQGSWNENTSRRIENLNAKKQELKNGVKALEVRYLERVRRVTDFVETDEEFAATAALMKAVQDALNPKEIPLGTVKQF